MSEKSWNWVRTLGGLTSWRKYYEQWRSRAEPRTRAAGVACSRGESLLVETLRREMNSVSRGKGLRKPPMNPHHPPGPVGRRKKKTISEGTHTIRYIYAVRQSFSQKMGDQSLRITRVLLRRPRPSPPEGVAQEWAPNRKLSGAYLLALGKRHRDCAKKSKNVLTTYRGMRWSLCEKVDQESVHGRGGGNTRRAENILAIADMDGYACNKSCSLRALLSREEFESFRVRFF